jgi:hypothetical protein
VERKFGNLALTTEVFRAKADLDPDRISTPVELLFALSVVLKTALILPNVNVKVCWQGKPLR